MAGDVAVSVRSCESSGEKWESRMADMYHSHETAAILVPQTSLHHYVSHTVNQGFLSTLVESVSDYGYRFPLFLLAKTYYSCCHVSICMITNVFAPIFSRQQ